jgi:hypothetical protein
MSIDSFKAVLFNDGEGLVHTDFNDSTNFLAARLSDQILESLVGSVANTALLDPDLNGQRGANAPTHLAYCLHGGSAYLRQGSANNKLQIAPGVLMQKTAPSDGNAPTFLCYSFAGTEEVTIANGDAANPRVDLVQMKLERIDGDLQTRDIQDGTTHVVTSQTNNKKRRVQCTLSVKQGTPAASPTYPDPDAGYVAVAGVVVGATYAAAAGFKWGDDTAGAVAVVHDQRMPLNVQAHHSDPALFKMVTGWSLTGSGSTASCTVGTNDLRVQCSKAGNGRLVGVSVARTDTLGVLNLGNNGSGGTAFNACNNTPSFGVGADYAFTAYYTFEGLHAPAAGPTVQPSPTNKIGPPLWTNGRRCARASASRASTGDIERLCMKVTGGSPSTVIKDVLWFIAEGV